MTALNIDATFLEGLAHTLRSAGQLTMADSVASNAAAHREREAIATGFVIPERSDNVIAFPGRRTP